MKVERRYQWFSAGGRWGYEPILTKRRVADGRIDLASGDPARIAVPVQWGQYRLEVRARRPRRNRAHEHLLLGRVVGANRRRRPPTSSTWRWTRRAPLRGAHGPAPRRGLPARRPRCRRRRVHEIRTVDLAAGGTNVSLEVRPEWGAGARRVALAHRPSISRAPPAARARGCMVRRRSRRPRAAGGACGACADTPAGNPEAADPNRRLERRRAGRLRWPPSMSASRT